MRIQRVYNTWQSTTMQATASRVAWPAPPVIVEPAGLCRQCRQPYCSCDVKRCECHPRGVPREERERRDRPVVQWREAMPSTPRGEMGVTQSRHEHRKPGRNTCKGPGRRPAPRVKSPDYSEIKRLAARGA